MKRLMIIGLAFLSIQLLDAETLRQNNVSIREGAASYFPVLKVLAAGSDVQILEHGENWLKVKTPDNIIGYIPALAMDESRKSIDYGVLADEISDRNISKTMVTAAVKGFFEHKLNSRDVNRDIMHQPIRRYFNIADYRAFKKESFRSSPWDHDKYMRKLRIREPGEIKLNNELLVTSAYIAGRLCSEGTVTNRTLTAYVNMVAQLIAEGTEIYDLPVCVHLADSDEIFANATPAGAVVISKGMLKQIRSEHELACLLGHEIAHITLAHGFTEMVKRRPKSRADDAFADLDDEFEDDDYLSEVEDDLENIADEMFERSIKGRKEEYEAEADQQGALYAARAGYDPLGMVNIMERLEDKMKRSSRIDDASHWFPYSFKKRKTGLTEYYDKYLDRRAPKYVTRQDRWQKIMN